MELKGSILGASVRRREDPRLVTGQGQFVADVVVHNALHAHFVRSIKVSFAGRKVFDAELDFSISENPTLRFNFVPHGQGQLRAEVEDSKDGHWVGTLAVL